VAFGVRNFENLETGLKEMLRVLKPGGKLIVLEFSRPRIKIFRSLYNLYMSIIAPEVARWFSQNKKGLSISQSISQIVSGTPKFCRYFK
jgi:demethylmenaquinone methyltransferase/2-methoxy-6-polyprenyl-1,4-benzoquinol methylase